MKLLFTFAAIGALSGWAQPAIVIPREMAPLRMLEGEWHTSPVQPQAGGGWVDFRFSSDNTKMIYRTRPDNGPDKSKDWRDTMNIWLDNGQVVADFIESNGHVIHYRLAESAGRRLLFEEAGGGPHRLSYRKEAPQDRIYYEFRNGDQVTDSGLLVHSVRIVPLATE